MKINARPGKNQTSQRQNKSFTIELHKFALAIGICGKRFSDWLIPLLLFAFFTFDFYGFL